MPYFLVLDIDDCKGQTCSGNGECVDLVNGFECECNEGFKGNLCEKSEFFMTILRYLNKLSCLEAETRIESRLS